MNKQNEHTSLLMSALKILKEEEEKEKVKKGYISPEFYEEMKQARKKRFAKMYKEGKLIKVRAYAPNRLLLVGEIAYVKEEDLKKIGDIFDVTYGYYIKLWTIDGIFLGFAESEFYETVKKGEK